MSPRPIDSESQSQSQSQSQSHGEPEIIRVEVVYGTPEHQALLTLDVPAGSTALAAAQASNIVSEFPDLVIDEGTRLGIFGQVVSGGQVLKAGDRVEIYRPLIADPKEVRKARAARSRERRDTEVGKSDGSVESASSDSSSNKSSRKSPDKSPDKSQKIA